VKVGPLIFDLSDAVETLNPVMKVAKKLIPQINGENAADAAGALVCVLVLLGKQTGAFTKEDALLAVGESWDAIHVGEECAPSA